MTNGNKENWLSITTCIRNVYPAQWAMEKKYGTWKKGPLSSNQPWQQFNVVEGCDSCIVSNIIMWDNIQVSAKEFCMGCKFCAHSYEEQLIVGQNNPEGRTGSNLLSWIAFRSVQEMVTFENEGGPLGNYCVHGNQTPTCTHNTCIRHMSTAQKP